MKCFRLLIAAGASPFVLKQKDQKFKTAEKASLRSGPYPANQGKPGLESLRLASPRFGLRFGKNPYALPTLGACFVFPDFG